MMHIKFVDDIGDPINRKGKHQEFFDALRKAPGRWAEFPVQGNASTRGSIAQHIRKGGYVGTAPGEFDAVNRKCVLYVRFVGGDA